MCFIGTQCSLFNNQLSIGKNVDIGDTFLNEYRGIAVGDTFAKYR
jgi:hypothetical protein